MADRWHLLKNLREAMRRFLTRQQASVEQATAHVTHRQLLEQVTTAAAVSMLSSRDPKDIQAHRAQRYARYCQVIRLHQQGLSQHGMARTLGINHVTVRTFLRAGQFPERATYRGHSQLEPYLSSLHQRWAAGCKNPTQLWHEIVPQGYRGTPRMVRRYIARLGQRLKALTPEQRMQCGQAETTCKTPSVRRVTFWLLQDAQQLTPVQEAFITQLCELNTEIKAVRAVAHAFRRMFQERPADMLPTWVDTAAQSAVSALRSFATGIQQDYAAVRAALAYEWSNGQVEGQMNQLKLIKRQMYGRAKLDLLRVRMLEVA